MELFLAGHWQGSSLGQAWPGCQSHQCLLGHSSLPSSQQRYLHLAQPGSGQKGPEVWKGGMPKQAPQQVSQMMRDFLSQFSQTSSQFFFHFWSLLSLFLSWSCCIVRSCLEASKWRDSALMAMKLTSTRAESDLNILQLKNKTYCSQYITNNLMRLSIPSKKIQINSLEHELVADFLKQVEASLPEATSIVIQGNSYSLQFCKQFGTILSKTTSLQSLDISDIFVARLKEEIPPSIDHIANGLLSTNLKHLDISHNAVNPFGAKALLTYLSKATSLEALLISNCGLGTLGVTEIAKGLEGTPNLEVLAIARNRMENGGIIELAKSIKFVPKLKELYVFQNTLRKEGLFPLFEALRLNCKSLTSFDLCDNFVREEATEELSKLIVDCLELKNLNLSDCLTEEQNEKIVDAFEQTKNRSFERLGFNYVELSEELAEKLLEVLKQCPIKRLDISGNDFPKKIQKAYSEAFGEPGQLSKFDEDEEDEEDEVLRLFEEMKI